ncbi:hypothetical protein F8O01_17705 [Pseudoclavibacter chungangensis]|uniref:Uncharacterized protein n=1 Tax=Pseudoclavibacter chungangensis TaxID=587635 RepID=A0A7J5BLU5_9MICO|nr:hypothetical protein F8O01_17705 [Pseudoclavibacter chungangensis]
MPGLPSSELGLDTPAPGIPASVPHLPLGSRCITCPNGIDRPHADRCSHTAEALQPIRHCSIIEKASSTPAGPGPAGCDVFALAASAGRGFRSEQHRSFRDRGDHRIRPVVTLPWSGDC